MCKAIIDEVFGEIKNFETEVEWLGRKISVSFDGGIESDWNEEKKVEDQLNQQGISFHSCSPFLYCLGVTPTTCLKR